MSIDALPARAAGASWRLVPLGAAGLLSLGGLTAWLVGPPEGAGGVFWNAAVAAGLLLPTAIFALTAHGRRGRALSRAAAALERAADGRTDLTRRLPDEAGELGPLAAAFDGYAGRVQLLAGATARIADRLYESTQGLAFASSELSRSARGVDAETAMAAAAVEEVTVGVQTIAESADRTAAEVNRVAAAAGALSGDVASVAESATQTSDTINAVASAVEEMSASLSEVAASCARAAAASAEGNRSAQAAQTQMARLAETAQRIGRIVELIDDIADQTNLLALNATIEAAGAGEAGKGFAVVANEVKALARQTVQATEEIAQQVSRVRADADDAVKQIAGVAGLIDEVSGLTSTIAAAVEEQTATTNEIARNVATGAREAETISTRVREMARQVEDVAQGATGIAAAAEHSARSTGEMAEGARGVSGTLAAVAQSAHHTLEQANGLRRSFEEIVGQADELTRLVGGYRYDDRGFAALGPKAAHRAWVTRLAGLVAGQVSLRPDEVSSHRDCEFGRWYFGEGGKAFGHSHTFREVDPLHLAVHDHARRIAERVQAGDHADAVALLDKLVPVSTALAGLLDRLEAESHHPV